MKGSRCSMGVPVVNVRIVGMAVQHGQVHVPVRVGLSRRLRAVVDMLVVLIVNVTVLVGELLVLVLVLVTLRQVQVHSEGHEGAGHEQDRKSTRLNSSHVRISYA